MHVTVTTLILFQTCVISAHAFCQDETSEVEEEPLQQSGDDNTNLILFAHT